MIFGTGGTGKGPSTRESIADIGRATFGEVVDGVKFRDHQDEIKHDEGLLIYTSAASWDPGSGAGFYQSRAGVWVFIV